MHGLSFASVILDQTRKEKYYFVIERGLLRSWKAVNTLRNNRRYIYFRCCCTGCGDVVHQSAKE